MADSTAEFGSKMSTDGCQILYKKINSKHIRKNKQISNKASKSNHQDRHIYSNIKYLV